MKKNIIAIILIALLCIGLCGCGNEETDPVSPGDDKKTVNPSQAELIGPSVSICGSDYHSIYVDIDRGSKTYSMYQIDVATDAEFLNIVSSDIYDLNIVTIPKLEPATKYYVRVRGYNGSTYSDFCQSYVITTQALPVSTVTVDTRQLDMFAGDSYKINLTILPEDASDKTITWTSTDESVATVSQDGTVTAVNPGNAAIIATATSGDRSSCAVHVGKQAVTADTEKLVIDTSSLNGNAVFGRYYSGYNRDVEQNVDFDGYYHLNSYEVKNILIEDRYTFGGLSEDVNVDGVEFSYTWTDSSDYDFDGNDCALVSDSHSTQTLEFIGAGAYKKIYLLSLAGDYEWNTIYKRWDLSTGDINANVTITYSDGSLDKQTVNFGNMMKANSNVPSYDAYTLTSITAQIDSTVGDAGTAPYMYAIPVECNPTKQISSITLNLENQNENRKVALAVFAVSGEISSDAPEAVESADATVSNLSEYGFNISWNEKTNADGYYVSVFEDAECTTACYLSVFSQKVYVLQAVQKTNQISFSNKSYLPGETYYVKVASYNENGSSKATVIPVTTTGTYPQEIRIKSDNESAELAIGESLNLSIYLPTTSYYTFTDVVWTVDKTDVLRVEDGKVTGLSEGTATVRAALAEHPEVYAEYKVTVDSYGDGWIVYDDGIFLSSDTEAALYTKFYAEISYGAIRITSDEAGRTKTLDKFAYYVSSDDTAKYEIYIVDEGSTPMGQTPVASGTVPTSAVGWTEVALDETVELEKGKEIWIAIKSFSISRADNESENGSIGKMEGRWTTFETFDIEGTTMIRAHML